MKCQVIVSNYFIRQNEQKLWDRFEELFFNYIVDLFQNTSRQYFIPEDNCKLEKSNRGTFEIQKSV